MKTKVLAVALVLGALTVLAAQSVLAHSRPVRLDPSPGAVLDAAPAQVRGWFTADLRRDPNWTYLHVTGPDGSRVDQGETVLSADRRMMEVQLQGGLGPGRYIVEWRTWDEADGAIFGDCYVFFVGQEAADAALAENFRLDAGSRCERIEVEARNATPVPGQTPQANGGDGEPGNGAEANGDDDDDDGVAPWLVAVGVGIGAVLGFVGARVLKMGA